LSDRLPRTFFARFTPVVAKELLGCVLVRDLDGEMLSGKIVETEAYRGENDPASHAFRGRTARNAVMFGGSGRAYVYFTMGMHWCLNVTTERVGVPGAVLIRALQPLTGIETMRETRGVGEMEKLMNGPAKLTKALFIDGSFNGEDLVSSKRLYALSGSGDVIRIQRTSRIGVSSGLERKWRFLVSGNPYVSKGKPSE
jgi:DNA-3-methyladenine glycosylase